MRDLFQDSSHILRPRLTTMKDLALLLFRQDHHSTRSNKNETGPANPLTRYCNTLQSMNLEDRFEAATCTTLHNTTNEVISPRSPKWTHK